jgi:hypothetical protein
MKMTKQPTIIVCVCAAALLMACSKKEEATPAAATRETQNSTATMVDEVKKQADAVTVNAKATAADAVKQVEAAKDSAVSNVNAVIEKAKTLVAETKYEDASKLLQQLAVQTLTPEQQKFVDDLKAQIQKALASKATSDASGAVGNLLKK